MVRRVLLVALTIAILATGNLFADFTFKGGAQVSGLYVHLTDDAALTEKNLRAYMASPYLSAIYSASNVRSEIRVSFSYFDSPVLTEAMRSALAAASWTLEKAYVRFRISSFGDSRLTIIAGKAPVSWGMGNLYRGGDMLFSEPLANEEAGTETEKSLWVVSLSQPIAGFTANLAFVPVLDGQCDNERIGLLLKRGFDNDCLKEVRAACVYELDPDKETYENFKASALVDMSIWLDLNVAVETRFRDSDDIRLVLNAMRMFTIETETRDIGLTFYISGQADFHEDSHDLSEVVSVDLTDRTTLTVMNSNGWGGEDLDLESGYIMLSTSSTLADGVSLNLYAMHCYKGNGSYEGFSGLYYDILAGAGLEYRF